MAEEKIIKCECAGDRCCRGNGVAVYEVTRNGRRIKVCTRCDLSADRERTLLPYVDDALVDLIGLSDVLGAICLKNHLDNPESLNETVENLDNQLNPLT